MSTSVFSSVMLGVFVSVLFLLILSHELGYFLGCQTRKKQRIGKDAPLDIIIAATLSVLALVLAFTFSMAMSLFTERKALVVTETNIISTAYDRAQYLPGKNKDKLANLLIEYLKVRVESLEKLDISRLLKESHRLNEEMWGTVLDSVKNNPRWPPINLVIESINHVSDLHASRIAMGLYARIPVPMWIGLLILVAAGISSLGFANGFKSSSRTGVSYILVATFFVVLLIIYDLDQPGQGFIRTDKTPTKALYEKIINT